MTRGVWILVVDDSEATREILGDALAYEGYHVQLAADGQQAWDLLRENPVTFSLVLSDLTMPEIDGLELLARLRMEAPWIKVVLITGYAAPEVQARAEQLGAAAVLCKPCGLEHLFRTIRRALHR